MARRVAEARTADSVERAPVKEDHRIRRVEGHIAEVSTVNYEGLTRAYWNQQSARVQRSVDQLIHRAGVAPGRVVPEAADLTLGTGRRLPMAVMFLDISNFSSRWSSTATEQANLLVILNLFFSEMTRIAEDYGGTVEKNTGDGLMAYFEDAARLHVVAACAGTGRAAFSPASQRSFSCGGNNYPGPTTRQACVHKEVSR